MTVLTIPTSIIKEDKRDRKETSISGTLRVRLSVSCYHLLLLLLFSLIMLQHLYYLSHSLYFLSSSYTVDVILCLPLLLLPCLSSSSSLSLSLSPRSSLPLLLSLYLLTSRRRSCFQIYTLSAKANLFQVSLLYIFLFFFSLSYFLLSSPPHLFFSYFSPIFHFKLLYNSITHN